MAKPKKREQARQLRMQGLSYSQIVEALGVAKSSVSNWCSDIVLSGEQRKAIRERALELMSESSGPEMVRQNALAERTQAQEYGRTHARTGSELHLMGCMLYWAEGAKSKPNYVHFANSDPEMLLLMMHFFREELDIPEEMYKLQIHCYTHDDERVHEIEQYWLDLLKLERDSLYKTQRLKGSKRSLNKLPNGICAIRINSTEHLMQILGAIQEYGGFDNPDWLF